MFLLKTIIDSMQCFMIVIMYEFLNIFHAHTHTYTYQRVKVSIRIIFFIKKNNIQFD